MDWSGLGKMDWEGLGSALTAAVAIVGVATWQVQRRQERRSAAAERALVTAEFFIDALLDLCRRLQFQEELHSAPELDHEDVVDKYGTALSAVLGGWQRENSQLVGDVRVSIITTRAVLRHDEFDAVRRADLLYMFLRAAVSAHRVAAIRDGISSDQARAAFAPIREGPGQLESLRELVRSKMGPAIRYEDPLGLRRAWERFKAGVENAGAYDGPRAPDDGPPRD